MTAFLAGCGAPGDAGTFAPPRTVDVAPAAVVTSFGSLSDGAEEGQALTMVKTTALSPSGRYLAIADRAGPFLRILDRESSEARAFAPEGEGPGELLAAHAVEFEGDSALLVLSAGQRLDRFGTGGEWIGGGPLGEAGLLVSAITIGCGGNVYAFGVPRGHRELDVVPWVHRLRLEPELSATPVLEVPGTGYQFRFGGALFGFDGTANGVLVWYAEVPPQVGYWVPCDGAEPSVWSHRASESLDAVAVTDLGDGRRGMALTLPDTLFGGAAARGSMKVRAHRPSRTMEEPAATTFHVVGADGCREVRLVGEWTLHDAHAVGLVLARHEPFPSVQVVDWTWFEDRLVPARCAP